MADYYPVLARAVSSLAVNNAQTREELYEYARTVLVAELERNNPERSTQAALSERIEFETTVLRVEAKSQLGHEKSPGTLLHRLHVVRKQHGSKEPTPETVSDFASLLRQPARTSGKPSQRRPACDADVGPRNFIVERPLRTARLAALQ
jgi:hypothetical protein